nr:ethanolamine utilization protein EutH [Bacillus subtilis]
MTVNDAVVFILAAFLLWGAADYCLGNRWGLGERFADGFKAMGAAGAVHDRNCVAGARAGSNPDSHCCSVLHGDWRGPFFLCEHHFGD